MFFTNMELHGMKDLHSPQYGKQRPFWSECHWFSVPIYSVATSPTHLPTNLPSKTPKPQPPPSLWIPFFIRNIRNSHHFPSFLFITKEPSEPPAMGVFGIKNCRLKGLVIGSLLGRCDAMERPNTCRQKKIPNHPPRKHHIMFPKIGVSQNGWFIMENPIKMDDLGVETPI